MVKVESVVLGSADIEIVVLPHLGARMHALRVLGRDLLRTPNDLLEHERDPFFWGAYVMAPWCNRLAAGRVAVAGQVVDLAPNFPDGSAIHGQVYGARWTHVGAGRFTIERSGGGWPWHYAVETSYRAAGLRLTIGQRLTNLDSSPMPAGLGIHPWLRGRVELVVNSSLVYPSNLDSPARPVPVKGNLDLRARQPMAAGVDATWAYVADPQVELWWPVERLHAVMRAQTATPHIVAANPPERRAMAVEPQTHAPQGLRRLINREPGAMTLVQPTEVLDITTTIEFDRL